MSAVLEMIETAETHQRDTNPLDAPRTTVLATMLKLYRDAFGCTLTDLEYASGLERLAFHRLEQGRALEACGWMRLQLWLLLLAPKNETQFQTNIGAMIGMYCRHHKRTLNDIAKASDLDPDTLWKLERGGTCEAWPWVKLQLWLMQPEAR